MYLDKAYFRLEPIKDEEPKHHCRTCHYFKFRNTYRLNSYTEICGFCVNDKINSKNSEQVNEICEFWSPNTKQESLEIALTSLQKCLEEIKALLGRSE